LTVVGRGMPHVVPLEEASGHALLPNLPSLPMPP
jgi:hypothetical protein